MRPSTRSWEEDLTCEIKGSYADDLLYGCCNLSFNSGDEALECSFEDVSIGDSTIQEVAKWAKSPKSEKEETAAEVLVKDVKVLPLEVVYPEGFLGATDVAQPEFFTVEVILDSGAGAHVISKRMIPGYSVVPSELSKAGAGFVTADGGRMANLGEAQLHMVTTDGRGGAHEVHSKFQVADVTRALWSVGVICESGLKVAFDEDKAVISTPDGMEVCSFERKNGLYVTQVQLRNPLHEGFQRQGK